MYLLATSCISPQDTFSEDILRFPLHKPGGNRWACIEPDYKQCINDGVLRRRMSRIVKMGVAAGLKCVERSGVTPDAIITSTGLGCLKDTERFLSLSSAESAQQLNPTPFIQSTFNTVGAQLSLMLGIKGYNNTYVHRTFSFESALLDTKLQIDDGSSRNILTGSFDEITDTGFRIMDRLGFWKHGLPENDRLSHEPSKGTFAGEGTAFFMFGRNRNNSSVQLLNVHFFKALLFSNRFKEQIVDFLARSQRTISDIDLLILGKNGNSLSDNIYQQIMSVHFPGKGCCLFKNLCGEYPTVSSFALFLANDIIRNQRIAEGIEFDGLIPEKFKNILIYNNYQEIHHSFILCSI